MRKKKPYRKFKRKEDPHKINERIRASHVRVVGEGINEIMEKDKAVELAFSQGFDLVELSPNAEPPVCKIMDYKKFLYEQKKKAKEQKSKQTNNEVKEIRFGPNTSQHDIDFKMNHARKFLGEGAKVRAFVFFRGRANIYRDRGEVLLLQFAEKLVEEGIAKIESFPTNERNKMIMVLAPDSKK